MGNPSSVLDELLEVLPSLRPQMYFKTSLTALSHAMEDQVLAGNEQPLMIASFQQERFYRQEAHRYLRLAEITPQVYVLAAADTQFADSHGAAAHETIAFNSDDALVHEWHLVVLGQEYTACLICREHHQSSAKQPKILSGAPALDQSRRFEGIWTLDRHVCERAAQILLQRIGSYRSDLAQKVSAAQAQFLPTGLLEDSSPDDEVAEASPFAQRLVTYVQASQYKLLKAYKTMAAQESRERLINSITAAIRQSLNPTEVFAIATHELGQQINACRCIIYRSSRRSTSVDIHHEFRQPNVDPLKGQTWPLLDNPLFQQVKNDRESITHIVTPPTPSKSKKLSDNSPIHTLFQKWDIRACLLVPLIYQDRLLGVIELHQCQTLPQPWNKNDIRLVEAVAAQLSVAVIQAEAYANLENLNQQLEALDRTRSNLIAITGHELRTPLSTIRVCLESIFTEPDMPLEMRNVMLQTALEDSERMQSLVQDFLTLSRLESGRIEWNLESLSLSECIALALSSRKTAHHCSNIAVNCPDNLPLIRGDGEWIVEVLTKVLDNACKFTSSNDSISIDATVQDETLVKVSVNDTGRGIEPERLETVFERFYQEEGALRRSVGGTGLGLAICRQIIEAQGGKIWAISKGKDQGTQINFTLPIATQSSSAKTPGQTKGRTSSKSVKISV
ncbi:DICT sensory domain-containing protein [Leptothoe kymatousa]|uniref:histidine kinase n=1 Tax=Leptothoe kymatousa TAU-MAC 1615 TaxID=2364775 RepID=A0ABS5Y6E6_9CYAN|nr:DICT sensory domain-containing protein [Leptothoe kymatousa]MBT9313382.1 GAF domain-containing protein [Leptothoe kymatousa TAU-MAC 1615]